MSMGGSNTGKICGDPKRSAEIGPIKSVGKDVAVRTELLPQRSAKGIKNWNPHGTRTRVKAR